MCGIAGVYGCFKSNDRNTFLNTLANGLAHRGPDGKGKYEDSTIGLIHTRLSIIDLSENGRQPFYNEDKSLVMICNGEIYNYKELRKELEGKGHSFFSNSDSEVIIHLYEEYSNDLNKLLNRIRGMFAFAIWDINKQQLLLARDRVGIKPLYYCYCKSSLGFASEIKPLMYTGMFDFKTDYTSLFEYFLLGSIPAPHTLYSEIKCLEAGTYLVLKDNNLILHTYWDIPLQPEKTISEKRALEELEHLTSEVIKEHLVADVPVGTFLSAGIDSSLITAIAVEHHPGINTFTASFPGEPEDEGKIAADTARKLKTTHYAYELKNNFFDDFSTQFQHFDQPFANQSALSLGRICKLAQQKVKVVLSGDGGDELFGGYKRHEFPKKPDFLQFIPRPIQNEVLKIGAIVSGKKSLESLRKNLLLSEADIFLQRISVEQTQIILSIFPPDIASQIDTGRYLRHIQQLFDDRHADDQLNRVLYVDMKTTLVNEMLTKCDRMTMTNSIEGRVPFLDHRLVEFAFSLPQHYKRQNGVGKVLLRKFLAKKLGNDLAFREKTGFNSPFKHWLNTDKATYEFALSNINEAKKLDILDAARLGHIADNLNSVAQESIFAVVCLNTFYKNIPQL